MAAPRLRIVTSAPVSTGTLLWRFRGQLYVSVAAKAAFALVHERPMELAAPVALLTGDVHHRNNPARSVRATTELVPYLNRADVVLVGHACAPSEQPASKVSVRLAVLRDGAALVDKTLDVHGDRKGGVAQPFERIPLMYERALGGVGWDDNPLGLGCRAGAEPDPDAANILDPAHPTRSAGFGPLSRVWPARRRLLGSMKRKALDEPIVEIPDDFDWAFFHAAPRDQRVDLLRGDEAIVVEGTHAALPRIETRLPGARVLGTVAGLSAGGPRAMSLAIDMLHIDADEQICTAVWRAALPVRDEAQIEALEVRLALEVGGQILEWSDEPDAVDAPAEEAIDLDEDAPTLARGEGKGSAAPAGDKTVALDVEASSEASPFESTVALDLDAPQGRTALPFAPTAREEDAPPKEKARVDRTYGLSLDEQESAGRKEAVPFAGAPPPGQAPKPPGQRAAVPGAPWSPGGRPVRPPRPATLDPFATVALDALDEVLPAPPAPDVAPPAAAPAPAPPALLAAEKAPPVVPAPGEPLRPAAPLPARAAPPRAQSAQAVIPRRAQDTVPVAGASPFATWTLPFQLKPGQDALVVVVKATCDLGPDGRVTVREEADPPSGDVHEGDDPMRTVRYPSDFVPFKPRADVLLTGHAHAPAGAPATQVTFRFGHRKNGFERRVVVRGERRWMKAGVKLAPTDPRPFKKVPLVYERAFGGPGFDRNPVGIGAGSDALPQLEDPARPIESPGDTAEPVCFAGVPQLWPGRWGKLGTFDVAWKKSRWPWLPDDADLTLFQAAPAAQQLDHLAGDEPFELAGVHPAAPVIAGRLPGVRPRCFAQKTSDAGGDFHEVVLRLDTVTFDADGMRVHLVWRGAIDARDDEASDVAELFVLAEATKGPSTDRAEALARYRALRAPPPEDALAKPAANDTLPAAVRSPAEAAALRDQVTAGAGGALADMDLADADLEGLDLSGRSFARAILTRARLRGAKLRGADLSGAQLGGADLVNADLTEANLQGADLTGADLTGAVLAGAALGDAILRRARGDGARFEGARGEHASFEEGSWKRARFSDAELTFADFSGATLDGAVLDGAKLVDVRLYDAQASGASLRGATLTRARADGAVLKRAVLAEVRASESVWDRAVLDESSFLGAVLTESGFARASGRRANFSGADLASSRLRRGKFEGAAFLKANLMAASLEAANLEGADLRGANLHGAETHKARLGGAQLDLAIVTQTKLAKKS